MQNEIMIQGEEGEQNRTGGGAGQHTTQTSKTLPKNSIKIYRVKGSGRTKLTIIHRLQVRRLRLQPRQHHRQRDAKGRSEIGRDGMWVHVDHRTFRVLLLFFSRGLVTILLFLAKDQVTLWAR